MEKKNLEKLDFVISVKQWFNYLNMNSCLHLPNKFKKCDNLFVNTLLKSLLYIYERVHRVAFWRPENPTKLNSFISIFKGFAKAVSFSELGTTFFKKYFPPSVHTEL